MKVSSTLASQGSTEWRVRRTKGNRFSAAEEKGPGALDARARG
jgi:hypothetical protein